jgi:radical SAM protein with 4Fe4S-binding SPASM domain
LHCGSSAGVKRENELATEEWLRVARELADMGGRYVTVLGGEPFLRKDWFEILKGIKEYGMDVTIISNGLLINEKLISRLRMLDLYAMAVSLDGATPETHDSIRQVSGSFNQCKKALLLLRDAGINTSVVTTLSKTNLKDLPVMKDFLLNKGIVWQIQIAVPMGRFPKQLMLSKEEFYAAALFIAACRKNYRITELPVMGAHCFGYNSRVLPNINLVPVWKGCQAGISLLAIQSNGSVKGCLSLSDEFIEGFIREKRLPELWDDPNFCAFNRNFKKENLKGDCKDCKYGKTCKGGCISVSMGVTGERNADPYCFKLIEEF